MCQFQTFYMQFGVTSNMWINMMIAMEIYRLLRSSYVRRRYFPPTTIQVYCNTIICYIVAICISTLPLLANTMTWDFIPVPGVVSGFLCLSVEYNTASTIFFWTVLTPIVAGVPFTVRCWRTSTPTKPANNTMHGVAVRAELESNVAGATR